MTSPGRTEAGEAPQDNDEYAQARRSRFRFKSKRSRRDDYDSYRCHKRKSDSHRHRHHRSKRRKLTPPGAKDDPEAYDDTYSANTRSSQYMDPDQAFRESLFDALADDEGAAYWEGVYGQPIHTYPNTYENEAGELEQMNDDEYAEYVRGKMWEKSHQHIIEERQKREQRRKEEKAWRDKTQRMEADREGFQRNIEESLRRGEERKARRRWKDVWERYVKEWENLIAGATDGEPSVEQLIPWPVESGKMKDVSKEEVEHFFRNNPSTDSPLDKILKMERVRWHPDKMQQRFGERGIDTDTIKAVTAIFQVIDRLWTEMREKQTNN